MLKSRKQNQKTLNNNSSANNNKKRYLILTYMVEYDKVHYPLPLNYEEDPDSSTLNNIIRRLKLENEELRKNKTNSAEKSNIQYENNLLRNKL